MTGPRLNVLVVSPVGEAGGAETLLLDILTGLRSEGVEASLLALGSGPLVALAASRGIPAMSGPPLSFRHVGSVVRAARRVRGIVGAGRPDVVLASHPKGQAIARIACAGLKAGHVTQLYDPPSRSSVRDLLLSRLPGLRLAITPETADAYRSMNRRLDPIVIRPAIDRVRLRSEASAGDGDRAWHAQGLVGEGPRIVMVARLQRFKGPFDLLEIARQVTMVLPHARFLLIGPDSPLEPGLREQLLNALADLGLDGVVGLAGRLSPEDLAATVSGATLCVHPAYREPFGLVIVEALTLGTPVVAYDTVGPRSILQGKGGAVVPCGDREALAAALIDAVVDPVLLARWVDETDAVASQFDIRHVVDKYATVLGGVGPRRRMKRHLTTVGAVPEGPSGVRDYGDVLNERLQERGFVVTAHWIRSEGSSLRSAAGLSLRLMRIACTARSQTVVWHYSPVPYGYRGIPAAGVLMGLVLRARGARVVTVLHELAYTFRPGGDTRSGWLKAVAQRFALTIVLAGSTSVVVTTEQRSRQLAARRRCPPTTVVPMFPTFAPVLEDPAQIDGTFTVGVPGFSGDGVRPDIVLDALAAMGRPAPCRIILLGAPGRHSPAGEVWVGLARERGIDDLVAFSGVLDPLELSSRFQSCHVIVLANEEGPSSRKTTLATALAHGLPTISLDGPNRWQELIDAGAVWIADVEPAAVRRAVTELQASPALRADLARRGHEFASARMSVDSAVEAYVGILEP